MQDPRNYAKGARNIEHECELVAAVIDHGHREGEGAYYADEPAGEVKRHRL